MLTATRHMLALSCEYPAMFYQRASDQAGILIRHKYVKHASFKVAEYLKSALWPVMLLKGSRF